MATGYLYMHFISPFVIDMHFLYTLEHKKSTEVVCLMII